MVESISLVEMKTTQQKEKTIEAVIDDTKLEQVIFLPQTQREREDVWFVLLDVPKRKSLFVPPGTILLVISVMFYVCHLVIPDSIDCCV